jgi:uncharacterized delta-60 repeat protein
MRILFTALTCFLFNFSFSQDGTVDLTFGSSGLTTETPPSGTVMDEINKTVTLPNGKILHCSSVFNSANSTYDFALSRFDMDGQLDPTFDGDAGNADGIVLTDFGGDDVATALTVQADGKIIVAGYRISSGLRVFAIARFNSDGTLDLSFDGNNGNGNGKFITPIGSDDAAYSVTQAGGKIVVAGYATMGLFQDFALVCYNISDGVLDTGFDTDGILTTSFGGSVAVAYSVKIQTDGKIIAAGTSFDGTSVFALARFNANGAPDTGFDGDGQLTTIVGNGGSDVAYDLVIHNTTGKIIVAGSSYMTATNNDFAMVLYNSNGSLDPYWNGTGKVTLDIAGDDDRAYSMILQSNLDIVLGGYSYNGTDYDFSIARFNADGSLDNAFNSAAVAPDFAGVNIIDFVGDDWGYGISLQGTNIIFGGVTGVSIALTRINNTGNALPVSLFSFSASKQTKQVALNWKTSSEENSWYFDIERSANGKDFVSVGTVAAAGNSATEKLYSFIDAQPFPATNFYRLRIVNRDESFSYSRILAVKFDADQTITVFPNPVKDVLQVQLKHAPSNIQMQLVDVSGHMIRNWTLKGTGNNMSTSVDLSGLQKGIYFLRADNLVVQLIKE